MIEVDLPYMEFGDLFQQIKITPHDISPVNEDKRIRVFCGQLMDAIVENVTKKNYMFHVSLFYKYGDVLLKKYPHRHEDLFNASIIFWEKVQTKYKGDKDG